MINKFLNERRNNISLCCLLKKKIKQINKIFLNLKKLKKNF